jgi:release factor glutamine methyltransferase
MTWRELRAQVAERLADAGVVPADAEARFLVERASGYDADEWLEIADIEPPKRATQRLREMVERRVAGEPLQYVMGAWAFRGLDLWIDKRVLIPRPETEIVVEAALEEAVRLGLRRSRRHLALVEPAPEHYVADLGTGSGAIALALEAELPDVEVWATDVSPDALAVARANIAGCAAARVRLAPTGWWFDALPEMLKGQLALVVSNPPYVTEKEFASLPSEVADYEPRDALVAGETGTEALEELLRVAPEWLVPGGTLVLEIAPHQASELTERATDLGYRDSVVRDDLAGRPRVLVARTA